MPLCRSRTRSTFAPRSWTLALALLALHAALANAQLRIVSYNTANGDSITSPRSGMDIVLEAIGEESFSSIAKPVDVLLLQEQDDSSTTTQQIANLLNSIYGVTSYQVGTLDGASLGAGRPGVVYNAASVSLQQQNTLGTVSSSNQPRATLRYRFRPVGYGADADFVAYNSHMKAGSSGSDENRRGIEATNIRNNANALANAGTTNLIAAGDLNVQGSSDAGYSNLTAAGGAGRFFDPINRPGNWNNNPNFADVHTQSPTDPSIADSTLITGGVDDRFDHQAISADLNDNEGLAYIQGTYRAFGNNGSTFNDPINDGNSAPLTGVSSYSRSQVFTALATASDHLPVVADYQLPASMAAQVTAPDRVIVGASVNASLSVENNANVVNALGADELDYTYTGLSGVVGSGGGVDPALGGANAHALALAANTVGQLNGSISVNASSQAAANPNLTLPVNVDVLAHSNASFDPDADQNALTVDFGSFAPGSGVQTLGFDLNNLVDTPGLTAALDLNQVSAVGDVAALFTDLAAFSDLNAGNAMTFQASFDTSAIGDFVSTITLEFSDEDLPGEQSGEQLTLELRGEVQVVEPDFTLALEFVEDQRTAGQSGTLKLKAVGADGDEQVKRVFLDLVLAPAGAVDIATPSPQTSVFGNSFVGEDVAGQQYTFDAINFGAAHQLPAGDSVLAEFSYTVDPEAAPGTVVASIDLTEVQDGSGTDISDEVFVEADSFVIVSDDPDPDPDPAPQVAVPFTTPGGLAALGMTLASLGVVAQRATRRRNNRDLMAA